MFQDDFKLCAPDLAFVKVLAPLGTSLRVLDFCQVLYVPARLKLCETPVNRAVSIFISIFVSLALFCPSNARFTVAFCCSKCMKCPDFFGKRMVPG